MGFGKNGGVKDTEFFSQLLGLVKPWKVEAVRVDMMGQKVEVEVGCEEGTIWTEGKRRFHIHGYETRRWRHLDTMQCETVIIAKVPRIKKTDDKGKEVTEMVSVPWAGARSRFTLWFEAWAIRVLEGSASVSKACELLKISWGQGHRIMENAVERGLKKRRLDEIKHVGMDEKNFGSRQSYISLMTDLDEGRVLEVIENRDQEAADFLWDTLTPEQRGQVDAVAVDMAAAYSASARENVPQAALVYDRFHISQHLAQAVDKVRRQEHRQLQEQGDERLKGTRQMWLYSLENLPQEHRRSFTSLRNQELKVSRAWAIKELFRKFWSYSYEVPARKFFAHWFGWARRSRLEPIKKVAAMLHRHFENIITYLKHPITNAVTEGLNSKIQSIKANARGFRSFLNYRTRILFFCGKLQLLPELPSSLHHGK